MDSYYKRSSAGNKKLLGQFRIQLLIEDGTRTTRYIIPKSDQYSTSSTQWTLNV